MPKFISEGCFFQLGDLESSLFSSLSDPCAQQLKSQCDAAFSMEWMLWYSIETITFREGKMLVAVYKWVKLNDEWDVEMPFLHTWAC